MPYIVYEATALCVLLDPERGGGLLSFLGIRRLWHRHRSRVYLAHVDVMSINKSAECVT